MNTFLKKYITSLKAKIIAQFNGEEIQSSDCFRLSYEIQEHTTKRVSETTLKRFFDFTSCAHNPSQYTLNALSLYCGYKSWKDFREHEDLFIAANTVQKEWEEVKTHISKITYFNLSTIRRKVPGWHGKMVSRPWVHQGFSKYEKSPLSLHMLHAPAGYGKSVAICKWVEEKLSNQTIDKDIVLYMDALSLFQSAIYGFHPLKWFANIFDFANTELVDRFFSEHRGSAPGFLHIVIDGLNEEVVSEKQYYAVISNLFDLINHYSSFAWLKFTLVVRSDIYEKILRFSNKADKIAWFAMPYQTNERYKFSKIELSYLFNANKIPHSIGEIGIFSNFEWLRLPKYYNNCLAFKARNQFLNFRSEELKYFLIGDVFEKKTTILPLVDQCDHPSLLTFLLTTPVISKSGVADDEAPVLKSRSRMTPCLDLMYELIGEGVLVKEHDDLPSSFKFASLHDKAYLLTYYIYHLIGKKDFDHFLAALDEITYKEDRLVEICCVWYIYFQVDDLQAPTWHLDHPKIGKAITNEDALYYLAVFSHHQYLTADPEMKARIRNGIKDLDFYRHLLFHARLSYDKFRRILLLLLEFEYDQAHEFKLRMKLAILAFLKWDEVEFIQQLEKMLEKKNDSVQSHSLDPVAGLTALYHYFKYGQLEEKTFADLFNFNFISKKQRVKEEEMFDFEFIGYLLILIANERELARKYLSTIEFKLNLFEDKSGVSYAIYHYLYKLIENNATGNHAYFNMQATHKERGFIQVFAQILVLHMEVTTENDPVKLQNSIVNIKNALEPLGYTLLSKYFAIIAFRNARIPQSQPDDLAAQVARPYAQARSPFL